MASKHSKVKELWEEIPDPQKRFEKFDLNRNSHSDLSAGLYLKRLGWTVDRKGKNLALVINFMQMKEFKYKFKGDVIEYIHDY